MKQFNRKNNQGISLVELMIGFAVGAILLALAGTSVQNISARSEIRADTNEIVQALRSAKHAARLANTSVTTEIRLADDNSRYIITFAFADHEDGDGNVNQAKNGVRLVDIELSDRVLVNSDSLVYKFDSLGMVDRTGVITLVSTVDSEYEATVIISDTKGYVTSSYRTSNKETS